MAKHDQKILKFLNQNRDASPTIIDMMTKLGINISDVSDSLSSLLAQGAIAKKTNPDGMECWFIPSHQPASSNVSAVPSPAIPAAPPPMETAPAPVMAHAAPVSSPGQSAPAPIAPKPIMPSGNPNYGVIPLPRVSDHPVSASSSAMTPTTAIYPKNFSQESGVRRDLGGLGNLAVKTDSLRPITEPLAAATTALSSESKPIEAASQAAPEIPSEALKTEAQTPMGQMPGHDPIQPSMPFYPMQQPKGIGFVTLVIGLVVAVAFSIWLGSRLTSKEIKSASANFLDRATFTEADAKTKDFEGKTKEHITALEVQFKQLSGQLDSLKAVTDSLKTALTSSGSSGKASGKSTGSNSKAKKSRTR